MPTATTSFSLKLRKALPQNFKVALREVRESNFIPYACHYDDSTILTKGGDLLQILKIEGLPFETADPESLHFQKNLRNTLLRSIAQSRYAVYVHMIRRKQSMFPGGDFPKGFSRDLNETWKKKQSALELYVNDFYLKVIQKAK